MLDPECVNRTVGLLLLAAGLAASTGTYFVVTSPTGAATRTRSATTAAAPAPSVWVTVQAGGPAGARPTPTATATSSAAPVGALPAAGAAAGVRTTRTASTATPTPTAAVTPLKIMALGDSITYGAGSATSGSYRVGLRRKLVNAGLAVDFVGSRTSGTGPDTENEGHNGWTIDRIAAATPGWLTTYRPDAVLLHIGTNDLHRKIDVDAAPARLAALVDRIHAARPAAHVYVQQLVSSSDATTQLRIEAFNAALPGVLVGKGPWLHIVDQSEVAGTMLKDKLHPNEAGYAAMADNLYAGLAATYGLGGS